MVHASPILDLPSRDCVPVLSLDVSTNQFPLIRYVLPPHYPGMGVTDWAIAVSTELMHLASPLCCESLWVYGGLQSFLGQT